LHKKIIVHFIRVFNNYKCTCNGEKYPKYRTIQYFFALWVRVTVFNTTFNNISVISWQSILLVEESTDLLQTL